MTTAANGAELARNGGNSASSVSASKNIA